MKTPLTPRPGSHRLNMYSMIRIGTLAASIMLIGIPLFSTSSASFLGRSSQAGKTLAVPAMDSASESAKAGAKDKLTYGAKQLFSANVGLTTGFSLVLPQTSPPPPSISTFDGTAGGCGAPKTEFNLGQEVCAQVTSTGGAAARRRITWQDPEGNVRQVTPITTDPQSDNFTIPSTPTSTLSNGQIANNIGKWRVNLVARSTVTFATFVVKDPANATADLSITKIAAGNGQEVAAGSNGSFSIYVQNAGPDDAAAVTLTDHVPTNTTFVSMVQTSGAPAANFTCDTTPNSLGNVNCTIATFTAGTSATFDFVYTVNAGTTPGSVITNTASIASATTREGNNADNSATATATVAGSGGGTGTCTISCPEDVVVQSNTTDPNNPNQPGAVVHFNAPTTDSTCGTVTISHCNDCFFPQGNTVVTATAASGDSCRFNVTVTAQSNAPTISCPPNKEVDAQGACQANVTVGTATATGGQNVTIFATRSDGTPMYDCDSSGNNCVRRNPDAPFPAGVTTITWTATSHDSTGAEIGSSSCTQTITVNNASDDTTAPVITCPANITRGNDAGQCSAVVNVGTATATDNCDSSPDVVGTRSDNQALSNPYPKGTTTITWTATDAAGNSSSCQQTVTVNDTESPTISCPANVTRDTDPGTCSATVDPGNATASDNCPGVTVSGSRSDNQPLSASYPKGTTTITWTATDASGNTSSCTQTITVEDHEAPVITCPANVTQGNDPGTCSATVNPGSPTASDNCGSTTVTGTRSDGQALDAPYPKGTTTITWTATDSSGNHSSCTQTITVVDNEAPTFTFTGTQTMWPPNHKYRTFTTANLVASVQDNCDGTIPVSSVVITKVTSDEIENGNGDGNTLKDIVIANDCKSVQLRAEREGNSDGRVYTIFYSVTDAAGNVGTGTTKVVVPHNPGQTAVDSGPHYTVTSNCP